MGCLRPKVSSAPWKPGWKYLTYIRQAEKREPLDPTLSARDFVFYAERHGAPTGGKDHRFLIWCLGLGAMYCGGVQYRWTFLCLLGPHRGSWMSPTDVNYKQHLSVPIFDRTKGFAHVPTYHVCISIMVMTSRCLAMKASNDHDPCSKA